MEKLRDILRRIDGQGYRAYREIRGRYRFGDFDLSVDRVQGDPFAAPSRISVRLPFEASGHDAEQVCGEVERVAFCDFLTRSVHRALRRRGRACTGSGSSGVISIDCGGQEILERSSVVLAREWIEIRLRVGLPAAGRRVLGRQADMVLRSVLPELIMDSVPARALDRAALQRHIEAAVDQHFLRVELATRELVAFIADGATLPRESGVSDRPLQETQVVPFETPTSLRQTFMLPSGREVSGMGIPRGLTLIVGGGYHGKSTLLSCIERGIYDHLPGDGRELCVSDPNTVKVRAEEGRRVEQVDISCFIDRLPLGKDTRSFCTDDASGSTSQATSIVEAIELGARVLLLDEDTSATNFLIRDQRMQALVHRDREPITPLVDRIGDITGILGCSLVLVLGGSGDYFEQADTVIMMDTYRPGDRTAEAHRVAEEIPTLRRREAEPMEGPPRQRIPLTQGFNPRRGRRDVKISASGLHEIRFGEETIDLAALEQLVDRSQTRAIGDAILLCARRFVDGTRSLKECLELLDQCLSAEGLDLLAREQNDLWREYARVRTLDLGAAINRLRSLLMR